MRTVEETLSCPACDCQQEHLCISCDERITVKTCIKNEGICNYCLWLGATSKGVSNEQN